MGSAKWIFHLENLSKIFFLSFFFFWQHLFNTLNLPYLFLFSANKFNNVKNCTKILFKFKPSDTWQTVSFHFSLIQSLNALHTIFTNAYWTIVKYWNFFFFKFMQRELLLYLRDILHPFFFLISSFNWLNYLLSILILYMKLFFFDNFNKILATITTEWWWWWWWIALLIN